MYDNYKHERQLELNKQISEKTSESNRIMHENTLETQKQINRDTLDFENKKLKHDLYGKQISEKRQKWFPNQEKSLSLESQREGALNSPVEKAFQELPPKLIPSALDDVGTITFFFSQNLKLLFVVFLI